MVKDLLSLLGIKENPQIANLSIFKNLSFTLDYGNHEFKDKFVLSEFMPKAVDDTLIVKTDADIGIRAKNIINYMIKEDISGKRFLDYGCGRGFCVGAASERSALAIGYDIALKPYESMITSNRDYIIRKGPYDLILLYDVVDHIAPNDLNDNLTFIKSLLNRQGRIYARVHPLTSRHGAHSYLTHNKAFIHLFYKPDDVAKMNMTYDNTLGVTNPKTYYDELFSANGFNIVTKDYVTSPVEGVIKHLVPFFAKEEQVSHYLDSMSVDFIDYVLNHS